ncbi:reprolysin-like metallopeptidase [Flavobacterium sp. W1B]|uniref:reprolysin-like metallopeptidase n=1 Tax=Flavobacterium sp. W1B TaxID=3394146 RepID=UPI0039BD0162
MKKIIFCLFVILSGSVIHAQKESPWKRINRVATSDYQRNGTDRTAEKELFFQLDQVMLKQSLNALGSKTDKKQSKQIKIPNRNGVLEEFLVWESSNFDPELQAKYPDIKSYAGIGVTDSRASLNFSLSPDGIQTMVLRADSDSEFIENSSDDKNVYVLFNSKSRAMGNLPFVCKTEDIALNKQLLGKASKISANSKVFKTLRLALSCTGEYATYHGGTVAGALAAMNATMTRVNGVFNRDLAVKLQLIANNDLIVYTSAIADPYSDAAKGVDGSWSQELQDNLTNVIGNDNYDIGHLFGASGGGGNAGCIGCVCVNPTIGEPLAKGSAYTSPGNGNPKGDAFDIDFVAHEMGHQLGANHTFSESIEGTGVNVEPGSGSTIMGYAGIADNNIQNNSDDYFAYVSIMQIQNNLASKDCPISVNLDNNPPVVSAGPDWTIPKGTAFVLTGTTSGSDSNAITYCWEQNDDAKTQSGSSSIAFPAKPDGPLFRSLKPSSLAVRYMPALGTVLSGRLSSTWESVSSIARTLHFTLTARDNASLGTAQTSTAAMVVNVSGAAGPFEITSQNSENLSWFQGENTSITWGVNGSNALQGSTNVNIKLSTDGGLTFPIILASNTPNDGSEIITVPDIVAKNCRILVEPTANIYYAINSKAFAIGYSIVSSCDTYTFAPTPFAIPESATYATRKINVPASAGAIVDVNLSVGFSHTYVSDVSIDVVNPQGTTVKLFEKNCEATDGTLLLDYDDLGDALSCGKATAQKVSPYEPLDVFNGQNPQGEWTFRVRDIYLGDTGTLDSASITICTQTYTLIEPDFKFSEIISYPNPSDGNVTVQFMSKNTTGVKILLHNMSGKELFNKEYESKFNFDENIQLPQLGSGIYLLTVFDGDRREVKKIIIQ